MEKLGAEEDEYNTIFTENQNVVSFMQREKDECQKKLETFKCPFDAKDELKHQGMSGLMIYKKGDYIIKATSENLFKTDYYKEFLVHMILSRKQIPNFIEMKEIKECIVNNDVVSALIMERADLGDLATYLNNHMTDAKFDMLDFCYKNLVQLLFSLNEAEKIFYLHGDLFNDNIFVKSTNLKYINFNGVWLPVTNNLILKIGDFDRSTFTEGRYKNIVDSLCRKFNCKPFDSIPNPARNNVLQLGVSFSSFLNKNHINYRSHQALSFLLLIMSANNLNFAGDAKSAFYQDFFDTSHLRSAKDIINLLESRHFLDGFKVRPVDVTTENTLVYTS